MNEIFNEEFIESVSSQILSLVLKDIDEKVEKIKKVEELPPYPNKSTVKKSFRNWKCSIGPMDRQWITCNDMGRKISAY